MAFGTGTQIRVLARVGAGRYLGVPVWERVRRSESTSVAVIVTLTMESLYCTVWEGELTLVITGGSFTQVTVTETVAVEPPGARV